MHTFQPVEPAMRSMKPSPVAARPHESRSASSRGLDRRTYPPTSSAFARARLARWTALLLVAAALLHAGTALAQALLAAPSLPLSGIARIEAIAVQSDGKVVILENGGTGPFSAVVTEDASTTTRAAAGLNRPIGPNGETGNMGFSAGPEGALRR